MAIYHFSAKVISRANGSQRGRGGGLSLGVAAGGRAARARPRLHRQERRRAFGGHGAGGLARALARPRDLVERGRGGREAQGRAARARDRVLDPARDGAGGGRRAGAGLRAARVRRPRHGGGPERALGRGRGRLAKPHAHVMLSMREVPGRRASGRRSGSGTATGAAEGWRERWASMSNARLAELGIDARSITGRWRRRASTWSRSTRSGRPGRGARTRGEDAERAGEHREIARRNGEKIIAEPGWRWRRSPGSRARSPIMTWRGSCTGTRTSGAVRPGDERGEDVAGAGGAGQDGRGRERFSTREMLATEERLERSAEALASARARVSAARRRRSAPASGRAALGEEQRGALRHVTGRRTCRWWWATPARARARCWGWRARRGRRRATRCAARRCRASRRRAWRRVGHRVAHDRQPRACLGAGQGPAHRAGRAGDRRGRDDRLAADGAGAVRGASGRGQGGAGRRPRAAAGDRGGGGVPGAGGAARRGGDHRDAPAARGLAARGDARAGHGRTGEALERYEAAGMVLGHDTRQAARRRSWRAGTRRGRSARGEPGDAGAHAGGRARS